MFSLLFDFAVCVLDVVVLGLCLLCFGLCICLFLWFCELRYVICDFVVLYLWFGLVGACCFALLFVVCLVFCW